MDYRIVPLIPSAWPGELNESGYERGNFSCTYARTLAHLERELGYLEGSHVVFQLDIAPEWIRQDGRLYAQKNPDFPGIVVTFNSKYGALSYYCDHYADWRSNLRAITICLQNLRKIDEHGVNKKGTQYTGYKRLPASGETTNGRKRILTDEEAAEFLGKFIEMPASMMLANSLLTDFAYKTAAKKLHPDVGGTDEEAWVDLQDAAALLKKRFGGG